MGYSVIWCFNECKPFLSSTAKKSSNYLIWRIRFIRENGRKHFYSILSGCTTIKRKFYERNLIFHSENNVRLHDVLFKKGMYSTALSLVYLNPNMSFTIKSNFEGMVWIKFWYHMFMKSSGLDFPNIKIGPDILMYLVYGTPDLGHFPKIFYAGWDCIRLWLYYIIRLY